MYKDRGAERGQLKCPLSTQSGHSECLHTGFVTAARSYLLATLQRVANGGDLTTDELDATILDPLLLGGAERNPWEELSHWANDGDICAKDTSYVFIKPEWMLYRIAALGSKHPLFTDYRHLSTSAGTPLIRLVRSPRRL